MKNKFYYIILLILCFSMNSIGQIITTVAGTSKGFSGDGGPATAAQLWYQQYITGDKWGNLYIVDAVNYRIRKVNAAGMITSIAGNGSSTGYGDGGPATAAGLKEPTGLAIDNTGNIYLTESWGDGVRKIDTFGVITHFAGNGVTGYNGDGIQATAACLNTPGGVNLDRFGALYIADKNNNRIRKVNSSGIISTVAGNGGIGYSGDGGPATAAKLSDPIAIVFDYKGNMFIADQTNHAIRKVDTAGIITTVAGSGAVGYTGDGGPATAAKLNTPYGLAVDSLDNIYIADTYNNCIRKVDSTGIITTIAGVGIEGFSGDNGPATACKLAWPLDIYIGSKGKIFISDFRNSRVRKIDTAYVNSVEHVTTSSIQQVVVYPNPNDGHFIVNTVSEIPTNIRYVIIDVLGKQVFEINSIANKKVDCQLDAPAGIYLLYTYINNSIFKNKIIIAR